MADEIFEQPRVENTQFNVEAEKPLSENLSSQDNKPENRNYVSEKEKWWYIAAVSFYTMFVGMINTYRLDFLTNVAGLNEQSQSLANLIINILNFVILFFITWYIDNSRGKKGKFKTLTMATYIPLALFAFMIFYFPPFIKDSNGFWSIFYIIAVWLVYSALNTFMGTTNNIAMVMTPNESERNRIISSKNFFKSIMNSAPLVVVLVLGLIIKKKSLLYIIAMGLCSVTFVIVNTINFRYVKERIPLLKKKNELPFKNMLFIFKNKNYWCVTSSSIILGIYKTGTAVGIFLSAAFFKGDTSKYVLFGLPTGIGTFLGMILCRVVMKKKSNIFAYKFLGLYSLVANALAFLVGYFYFTVGGTALLILFFIMLFPVGLQFGLSNILPEIFNAEILNEIELQTGGKRLEQTMAFTSSFLGMLVGIGTAYLGPFILLNPSMSAYVQGEDVIQSQRTNIMLLFFYTLYAGIFFALSILPMLGYSLNEKRRKAIMEELLVLRAERQRQLDDEELLDSTGKQDTP